MASLDVFHQDPFTTIQLTAAVDKYPFQPMGLGELDIFDDEPIRNTALAVEQRQGKLIIIPTSPRGAEGTQRTTETRQARYFKVPRLMHDDTVYANEIQDIRAFGTESELMQVQVEVARRMNGPTGILRNIEYTWEYHRLAAVQGQLLDADGSVLYDWFDEFGITPADEVAFDLSAQTEHTLRPLINQIRRTMARHAQGAFTPNTRIYALCGDEFYDEFTNHVDVIRTFINWSAAADLRDDSQGAAFDTFKFAGVYWMNYRGSDDNTTIKVPDDKVKFFPVGAPGIFRRALAPGESFEWVNTPGKPTYVIPIFDRDRNSWWKMEAYSYPLHICTRPEVLMTGRAGD
ncbi:major capsid protein [Paraburkholderia caballeronis]|uniref:Phage major capsid protein E n=1 Tax=Paraburkholderia caballeronis TaxID=416943 RepID=A0A1H7TZA1_9BURK|nr:major capsid protein [Paraburkholderia caballeronis]PXW23404.1 major capsid protein E [Paraburkholderia caballeronis]PXW98397.1 major capsid protein E [Paraburkholderia caballeronis]RAJ95128.1 major capsid protein E [Paraburkholderia caballeronis]SEC55538.1 Phage major capsid protein E [Paraburkholderia caballeronis]SEL89859.1 Phage major capsid protein E [Paraburkholderia caballeronis]